jgi:hypothetical protein
VTVRNSAAVDDGAVAGGAAAGARTAAPRGRALVAASGVALLAPRAAPRMVAGCEARWRVGRAREKKIEHGRENCVLCLPLTKPSRAQPSSLLLSAHTPILSAQEKSQQTTVRYKNLNKLPLSLYSLPNAGRPTATV